MPANLTPQYYAAEEAYKQAGSSEEKLAALQEMLSVIPKHKGTEKLQAEIKKKIAALRREGQKKKARSAYNPFAVEKQGAGQVVLVGYPNTGKSALVESLTRAKVKVADYPYSTSLPVAGMMPYEDIHIQLVDTPPVTVESVPAGLWGTIRGADALLILVDLGSDQCLEQLEGCLELLHGKGLFDREQRELKVPCRFVGTKCDRPSSAENSSILAELYPWLPVLPVSAVTQRFGSLRDELFALINVIRVYSKEPGREAEMSRPFTLPGGSTVLDFAALIHREFPQRLRNAYVWGSARFAGQAVARDYLLQDRDIVELDVSI